MILRSSPGTRWGHGTGPRTTTPDFWKLREVGIRYLVPESLSSRIGAENASLILSAREVGIIWRRQATTLAGIQLADPEMGYSNNLTGSVQKTTPPLSRMTVEARVSF